MVAVLFCKKTTDSLISRTRVTNICISCLMIRTKLHAEQNIQSPKKCWLNNSAGACCNLVDQLMKYHGQYQMSTAAANYYCLQQFMLVIPPGKLDYIESKQSKSYPWSRFFSVISRKIRNGLYIPIIQLSSAAKKNNKISYEATELDYFSEEIDFYRMNVDFRYEKMQIKSS